MTAISVNKNAQAPIQIAQWARNGMYPSAEIQNLIASLVGHAALVRSRLIFRSPGGIIGTAGAALIPSSVADTRYRWRLPYRSGPYARWLFAQFQMAPQNDGDAADPVGFVEVATDTAYASVVAVARANFGSSDGIGFGDVPTSFGGALTAACDATTNEQYTLTPITQYYLRFGETDYARIQSVALWEYSLAPDTDNGYPAPSATANGPIYDADREACAVMARALWENGAAPLFYWASETDADAPVENVHTLSFAISDSPDPAGLGATITWTVVPTVGGGGQTGMSITVTIDDTHTTTIIPSAGTLNGWTVDTDWSTSETSGSRFAIFTKASVSVGDTGFTFTGTRASACTVTATLSDGLSDQVANATEGGAATTTVAATNPTFVASGTIATGTGNLTPTMPTHLTNDILVVQINQTWTTTTAPSVPGGWTAMSDVNSDVFSGVRSHCALLWKRAASGAESAPTITDNWDAGTAQIHVIRGCVTSGDPWDVLGTTGDNSGDTSLSIAGVTTTVNNCLVVDFITGFTFGSPATLGSLANGGLTSFTEQVNVNEVVGGEDLHRAVTSGVKATAGATGATTGTWATGTNFVYAGIKVAFEPA